MRQTVDAKRAKALHKSEGKLRCLVYAYRFESAVTGFLSLPIRLLGIVLMTAFMVKAMAPLNSFQFQLANINAGAEPSVITQTDAPFNDAVSLLPIGLALVAIISIWLIYQTYSQHVGLANNELRNRRAGKNIRI